MFEQFFPDIDKSAAAIQWSFVIGGSLLAAIFDLRSRRIPNWLTFSLLMTGLVWAGWKGGFYGIAEAVGACVMLALPFVLLFLFAGGGAGDAKLMGAIGAWLGLRQGLAALLCVTAAGIVLALVKAAIAGRFKVVIKNIFITVYVFIVSVLCRSFKPAVVKENDAIEPDALTIPYGAAILAGVCAAGGIILL